MKAAAKALNALPCDLAARAALNAALPHLYAHWRACLLSDESVKAVQRKLFEAGLPTAQGGPYVLDVAREIVESLAATLPEPPG